MQYAYSNILLSIAASYYSLLLIQVTHLTFYVVILNQSLVMTYCDVSLISINHCQRAGYGVMVGELGFFIIGLYSTDGEPFGDDVVETP